MTTINIIVDFNEIFDEELCRLRDNPQHRSESELLNLMCKISCEWLPNQACITLCENDTTVYCQLLEDVAEEYVTTVFNRYNDIQFSDCLPIDDVSLLILRTRSGVRGHHYLSEYLSDGLFFRVCEFVHQCLLSIRRNIIKPLLNGHIVTVLSVDTLRKIPGHYKLKLKLST